MDYVEAGGGGQRWGRCGGVKGGGRGLMLLACALLRGPGICDNGLISLIK